MTEHLIVNDSSTDHTYFRGCTIVEKFLSNLYPTDYAKAIVVAYQLGFHEGLATGQTSMQFFASCLVAML